MAPLGTVCCTSQAVGLTPESVLNRPTVPPGLRERRGRSAAGPRRSTVLCLARARGSGSARPRGSAGQTGPAPSLQAPARVVNVVDLGDQPGRLLLPRRDQNAGADGPREVQRVEHRCQGVAQRDLCGREGALVDPEGVLSLRLVRHGPGVVVEGVSAACGGAGSGPKARVEEPAGLSPQRTG